MRIEINANNNTLTIDSQESNGKPVAQATYHVKHAYQQRQILSEMLNRLDIAGVVLEYIDEDTRSTEEW
jgi:glutamate-1-semialdehyde aminotransferase